ncbi:MAG: isocitrate/isopropylmalate family dehydrogenase [Myxococcota bacterium]
MSEVQANKTPTVSLIRGDGIGPEISDATVRALEAAGASLEWQTVPAGMGAIETDKDPLPQKTIDSITENKLALKGPLATPSGGGYRSVNVALRKHFDLYANVRPAKSTAGVPARYDNVDLILVRENTEGMYSGIEHYVDPRRNAAESIAIVTRYGSERVIRFAFELARSQGRKKVTLIHKANILKMTDGLFLDVGRAMANEYSDIEFDDMIIDATAMTMVIRPERFDVVVTTNLFGDILSDLAAGLIGGLGVAPAANMGSEDSCAIFEAVHGTAPDIAGKGLANPTALMRSAAMLLDHVGQGEAAARLRKGIDAALANDTTRTGDLGGSANTKEYTDAVIAHMGD